MKRKYSKITPPGNQPNIIEVGTCNSAGIIATKLQEYKATLNKKTSSPNDRS